MMMKSLITLTVLLISVQLFGQTPMDQAPRRADVAPAWPGCEPKLPECTKSRLSDFIAANLQIPMSAKEAGVGGVVVMEFVVEKNGTIGEVKALKDPGHGLASEATRVIELMKAKKIKWTPAVTKEKRIPYRYVTPVSFSLDMPVKAKTTPAAPALDPDMVFEVAEVMPVYSGCEQAAQDSIDCTFLNLVNHMKSNIKYPEEAVKNKIQGQIVVEFIVDKTGAVTMPTVTRGLGHGCDEEALRVIGLMPAWVPGKQGGQPVKVKMVLPVLFQLPKE